MLEALYVYIHEDDSALPDSTEAVEVAEDIWPRLRPFGHEMKIEHFHTLPIPEAGQKWSLIHVFPLLPANAPEAVEEYGVKLSFVPTSKRFRGGFSMRATLFYDQDRLTNEYLDERAALLVEIAEDWLELRAGFVAYLSTAPVDSLREQKNKEPFPNTVTWWTWINSETADAVGRERLLDAPVHKAYELAEGVAWQLTERFTQKPHPSLLGDLNSLFPERKVVVQTRT